MAAPRGEGSPGRAPGGCGGPWGALRAPPPALLPCPCPVLASYSLLAPPLSLLAPPVPPAYEAAPWLPGTGPCPPRWPQPPAPGRARAGGAREGTRALKAWLARHPRKPYPSRGEKAALAALSRRSLAQVSTWFANARRRLRKEHEAARGASDGDDSESEGGPRDAPPGPDPGPDPDPAREGGAGGPEGGQPPRARIWSVVAMLAGPPGDSGCPPGGPEQG